MGAGLGTRLVHAIIGASQSSTSLARPEWGARTHITASAQKTRHRPRRKQTRRPNSKLNLADFLELWNGSIRLNRSISLLRARHKTHRVTNLAATTISRIRVKAAR